MRQFEPISTLTARWQAWEDDPGGLEHVEIRRGADVIIASGLVIASDGSARFGLHYRLSIDESWCVRDADLRTVSGARLHLQSDGGGRWIQDGRANPALDGCIDIDIEATPFTNTLPIRRLGLAPAESRAIRVAYIRVPTLAVAAGNQRYTAIEPGTLYRFESLDHDFTAELPVDRHGLVRDYPGLFRRLL